MKTISLLLAVAALNLAAYAGTETFDLKDPKGVNNAKFKLVAPGETIEGVATNISGSITFDPASPAALKGKIAVEVKSMHLPNSLQQNIMQSAQWLDAAKYPQITFDEVSLDNVKTTDNLTTADVTGTFTLHGVSKKITAKAVTITYLKDKLKDRFPQLQGDLLVINAKFMINRGDFNINKGQNEDKVAEDIQLDLAIAGQSPR